MVDYHVDLVLESENLFFVTDDLHARASGDDLEFREEGFDDLESVVCRAE